MQFGLPRLFLLGTLLTLSSSHALGGVRYVDAQLGSGANNGSSWSNAFQGSDGVRVALAAALAGDQIWVAQGSYKPTATLTRTIYFALKNNVELYGGFAGGETLLSQRNVSAHVTILHGDLNGDDGSSSFTDNTLHILDAGTTDATAVLDGFTIRGGNAGGVPPGDRGGGMLCLNGASPTIRNCVFRRNRGVNGGGAVYVDTASPTFVDTLFESNNGGVTGGACDMASNDNAVFTRCQFISNIAARGGGVELFGASNAKLTNCLFLDNISTGSGGGALSVVFSIPTIRNCTIIGNRSTTTPTGGLLSAGSSCAVTNCVIYFNQGPGGVMGLVNNISGAGATATYSCIQGGLPGAGNISADPLLVNLAGGDAHLASGSPCTDAGNNTAVPAGTTSDLYGNARLADNAAVADTGTGGFPVVDMGANEVPNTLYTFFCAADGSLATPCPCGNIGSPGRGCGNSDIFSAGGLLGASGSASPDTVALTASDMLPTVSCVFLQGNAVNPNGVVFGDGIRCVAGSLKRLYIHSASGSAASAPVGADLSISARSAVLGDTINPGELRFYQVYYRDPDPTFCPNPPGNTWNVTAGVIIQW